MLILKRKRGNLEKIACAQPMQTGRSGVHTEVIGSQEVDAKDGASQDSLQEGPWEADIHARTATQHQVSRLLQVARGVP